MEEIISRVLFVCVFIICYLIPIGVAYSRGHRNTPAISALCILLGWTTIGWVIAFIWSLTSNTKGD